MKQRVFIRDKIVELMLFLFYLYLLLKTRLFWDIPDDYTILQSTRSLLGLPSYVLTLPMNNITSIGHHINALPTEGVLTNEASQIYREIKYAFNTIINCPESSSLFFLKEQEYT